MRRILALLPLIFISTLLIGQIDFYYDEPPKEEEESVKNTESMVKSVHYQGIGFGTGINSPIGFLGLDAEIIFYDRFGLNIGVGLGSWGTKASVTFKQYLGSKRNWSFNAGYSYSSGADDVDLEMDSDFLANQSQTRDVNFDLLGASNLNLSFIYHLRVGKEKLNRLLFEFGYSIQLQDNRYRILDQNVALSDQGKMFMSILQPGGLMLAMRFNFGI